MKTYLKILALITSMTICSLGLYAYSGTTDPKIPDEKYIEYAKNFHYVFKLCGTYNDGKLFCASAVVINKNWIITAAHVVKNCRLCIAHKDDKAYLIDEIFIHKDFEEDTVGIADIALLYVKEDIGLEFYPPLYENNDEIGKLCSIAGYGMYGTFLTGITKSDGNIRAGSNIIDNIEKDLLICTPSINERKTELEYIIGSGDSGGGLFIGNHLAGINSCVLASDKNPNSTYGDESCHTRISKFVPWIRKIIDTERK